MDVLFTPCAQYFTWRSFVGAGSLGFMGPAFSGLNAQVIGPLSEVAIVFLGVFTTAIPVMEVVQDIVVFSMPWLTFNNNHRSS